MKTIKITTNGTTKNLEVAEISKIMEFFGFYAWSLSKPIRLDGKKLPPRTDINFEDAIIEVDGQTYCGSTSLFVCENVGIIKCHKGANNALNAIHSADSLRSSIDLNDISGSIGPFFSYDIGIHLDTSNFEDSYFAAKIKVLGITIIDTRLDASNPEISFGGKVAGVGAKVTLGVDFNGGRIYFEGEIDYLFGHKTYSLDLYSWKNYKAQFTPVAKGAANLRAAANSNSGWIAVENEGWYVAKFDVSYTLNGERIKEDTGDFTAGVTKVIDLPAGATDIVLHVWDAYFIKSWREIFSKNFDAPVTKKYKVTGTTLDPDYEELDV